MIRVDDDEISDLVVKIASTPAELTGAFRLLHDTYVGMGFCSPQPDGLRRVAHHSCPGSLVIIAKTGDQVVGTLTLASEELFDLPVEKHWELSRFREGDKKVIEATCFAIDRAFRRSSGKNVFFPLIRFMFWQATQTMKADYLAVAAHPNVRDFYEGVLCFESIDQRVVEDYIRAPAAALILDLGETLSRFHRVYAKKNPKRNLYHYFIQESPLTTLGLETLWSRERGVESPEAQPDRRCADQTQINHVNPHELQVSAFEHDIS